MARGSAKPGLPQCLADAFRAHLTPGTGPADSWSIVGNDETATAPGTSSPPMTESAKDVQILVLALNAGKETKYDVEGYVALYKPRQWFGPFRVADELLKGRSASRVVTIPNVDASTMAFTWGERIGGAVVKRAQVHERGPGGPPKNWNGAVIEWQDLASDHPNLPTGFEIASLLFAKVNLRR